MTEAQKLQMKLVSLSVRLTKADRVILQKKADEVGCSKSDYIRKIIVDREVKRSVVPPINQQIYGELVLMRTELRKQGTNLNQIAQFLHVHKHLPQESAHILSKLEATIENLGEEIKVVQCTVLGKDDRQN